MGKGRCPESEQIMPYQETSGLAFDSIQEKLGAKQKLVLWTLLSQGNMTNSELSDFLGWPINCIVPRTNELVKLKKVEAKTVKRCSTGRSAIVWGTV